MKSLFTAAALTCAIAAAWPAVEAQASVANHGFISNSVNYCQAFTPGPANTVRNRVVGAENVGTVDIAVACNFHTMTNGAAGATPPTSITIWFANNNASTTVQVSCTLLTGWQGAIGYTVAKTTTAIPAGGEIQRSINFATADNPTSGATSLGNSRLGVNCTLPPGAVINDVSITWPMDNGVGT